VLLGAEGLNVALELPSGRLVPPRRAEGLDRFPSLAGMQRESRAGGKEEDRKRKRRTGGSLATGGATRDVNEEGRRVGG